jgi:hypothetical protein
MPTPGDEGRARVDACATCNGCERCRWVATHSTATHVIEVKVKVRHFCEHHGIGVPDGFIMAIDDGTWFTQPELRLPRARSGRGRARDAVRERCPDPAAERSTR